MRYDLKGFKVIHAGVLSSIQDQGRYGQTHLGITQSGAMDEYAYLWSQKLLHNHHCNALEVMVGLKLEVLTPTMIAICGADLSFQINGIRHKNWQTHYVKKGDILSFPKRISGQRAYLSVKEGFLLQKQYNSYATTLKENSEGKATRGDILHFRTFPQTHIQRLQTQYIPHYDIPLTLRLFLCYQTNYFSQEQQDKFFSSEYEITLETNRMGAKLRGRSIRPMQGGIISEGIAFGSVQIPQDGQPILLLKERQTIGGYPKIGTVLAIDCFRFSQLGVGSKVRFEKISLEVAREKSMKFLEFISSLN
jgi:biotin-dependent carboxylase-like uncharacterized protein